MRFDETPLPMDVAAMRLKGVVAEMSEAEFATTEQRTLRSPTVEWLALQMQFGMSVERSGECGTGQPGVRLGTVTLSRRSHESRGSAASSPRISTLDGPAERACVIGHLRTVLRPPRARCPATRWEPHFSLRAWCRAPGRGNVDAC